MRLVAEIESRRRLRGAEPPWTRLSLSVRVRWSGRPGVRLPASLRDRRLTVRRETTAPETYRRGDRLNLSAEEAALLPTQVAPRPVLASPEIAAIVDTTPGAVLRDLVLAGEASGTVASSPLRLGVGEGRPPVVGGAFWEVESRKGLWKARFRIARSAVGSLRLVEKAGKDKAHAIRTLTLVPGTTLVRDLIELVPERKKERGKGKRPDLARVSLDLSFDVGDGARVLLPEHDRLVVWHHTPDPVSAWLMWAGNTEERHRPRGGFIAAVGGRAVHVLLFAPREADRILVHARRDHPAATIAFARTRPPLAREVVHVVGRRAGFADRRAVAVLAETTDPSTGLRIAHVVAYRRGARVASGRAVVSDDGCVREVTLERRDLGAIGAVHVGRVALDSDRAGEVEVRLGRDRIRIESAR